MFFTKCLKSKGLRVHLFKWDNLQNSFLPLCMPFLIQGQILDFCGKDSEQKTRKFFFFQALGL